VSFFASLKSLLSKAATLLRYLFAAQPTCASLVARVYDETGQQIHIGASMQVDLVPGATRVVRLLGRDNDENAEAFETPVFKLNGSDCAPGVASTGNFGTLTVRTAQPDIADWQQTGIGIDTGVVDRIDASADGKVGTGVAPITLTDPVIFQGVHPDATHLVAEVTE
jgi:hypothetical protein